MIRVKVIIKRPWDASSMNVEGILKEINFRGIWPTASVIFSQGENLVHEEIIPLSNVLFTDEHVTEYFRNS